MSPPGCSQISRLRYDHTDLEGLGTHGSSGTRNRLGCRRRCGRRRGRRLRRCGGRRRRRSRCRLTTAGCQQPTRDDRCRENQKAPSIHPSPPLIRHETARNLFHSISVNGNRVVPLLTSPCHHLMYPRGGDRLTQRSSHRSRLRATCHHFIYAT